jgi:hypothetical protein
VSPVRYELGSYIPEEDILHSHSRENLKFYDSAIIRRCNMQRFNLKVCTVKPVLTGISRDQKICPLKPGFRLIKVYYILYCNN